MSLTDALLPEFDQEMANTRKALERLPDDKLGWRPHDKSYTFGDLARHLAQIPGWTKETLEKSELDIAPPGQPPMKQEPAKSCAAVLEEFDKNVKAGREVLSKATDADWGNTWSLLAGGHVIFTLPKAVVMRTWVLSHIIHHRAQFGVYLRLNDIPVPSIYGPSADDSGGM